MAQDRLAERRRELERRLAELSASKRAEFERSWDAGGAPVPPSAVRTVPARDPAAPIPMSYAQEMLWLLERTNPGHAYNVPRMTRLRGPLDLEALSRALDALVERHEVLRTTFVSDGGELRQQVHPPAPVPVLQLDFANMPEGERDAVVRERLRQFVREPFDLENDSQLRVCLARLGDEDHVLTLVSHHVASDGWSGNVLLRELDALYDAARRGTPGTLPPVALQYGDYAAWQRNTLIGDRLEELLAFWRRHLSDTPASIDLPTDRPRPPSPGFDGALRSLTIAPDALHVVQGIARDEGATNFMALLAVYFALVSRLSGEDQVVVATPVAGRAVPELDGVVGFFANTLLLRASLDGRPSFRALLRQVRDACLQAFDQQQVPLEMLLSGRAGVPVAPPQLMFMTEDPGRETFRLAGTEAVPFGAARGATKLDVTLHAALRPDGLRLTMEYRTELFDATTIDRFLHHYVTLLTSAAEAPDRPIAELAIMEPAERAQVLVDWNRTNGPYDRHATLHGLVRAQALRSPDDIAVTDGENALTYGELGERAATIADELQAVGVGPDTVVGICLPRSVDLVVTILGILQAGGCYLPLDPEYPAERLSQIVDDSGAELIITQGAARQAVPESPARLLVLERDVTSLSLHAASAVPATTMEAVPVEATATSLAYVIYTSGSTGRPKGVEIAHQSVVNFLAGLQASLPLGPGHVLVAITPLSFDISVLELFHPLVNGARLVVAPPEAAYDARLLAGLLDASSATHLQATPSTWRLLVESGWQGRPGLVALCGGEAMPPSLAEELLARGAELWNMYGPTEATIWATMHHVTASNPPIPIGRPMANVRSYVLDAERQPVPAGVAGELYLGGECLARGYRDRPELTAEHFVADPFSGHPGARMYRTGDRARWRADGTLECLGRTDFQVKLRGHRIELGEVEHLLTLQPGVAQAIAIVREDAPGDQRLVAYVVASEGASPDVAALRGQLRQKIPAIMVPATIVLLDALPLTPNGKVDRKTLPRPDDGTRNVLDTFVAPATPLECDIASVWEKSLGVARVGVQDDFFDLGGSSLLAMRMIAEIERLRDQRIPFQAFFERPTIANIAAVLVAGAAAANDGGAAVLQKDGPGTPLAFVHGDALGFGWYCRRLVSLLGEAPLIVLPTLGPRTANVATSTEAIATAHIAALRSIQPRGPYRVGGFCHGGLVAYEMARQLMAAGEAVERLVMVDPFCSNLQFRSREPGIARRTGALPPEERVERRAALYGALQYRAQRWRQMRKLPLLGQLRWMAAIIGRRLGVLRRAVRPVAPIPQDDGLHDDRDLRAAMAGARATLQFVARAQRAFMPAEYRGHVTIIWAREAMTIRPWLNRWGGWNQVAPQANVMQLPGTHIDTISPAGLPALAERIRQALLGDSPDSAGR